VAVDVVAGSATCGLSPIRPWRSSSVRGVLTGCGGA
jgi:hypothetical protein